MNDRFKFRFWRKHYDGKFTLECADLMSIDGSADPYNVGEGDVYCYHPGETIIEQCTGLKDKNGNLVFEGDVILINGEKWRVIWSDEDCAFFFSNLKEVYHQPIFPDFYMMAGDFKVIGNVHENPELLK